MSINLMEVYMKCPVCGEITTKHDYHENTSSDRFEYFLVLNGKNQCFVCPFCKNETSYDHIFTEGYCKVEDLEKSRIIKIIQHDDSKGIALTKRAERALSQDLVQDIEHATDIKRDKINYEQETEEHEEK